MKKILSIVLCLVTLNSFAWEPKKPITVYIGAAPATPKENIFRIVSAKVTEATGAQFIYEHKPSPGSVVSNNDFVNKANDGHHISLPSVFDIWVHPELKTFPSITYGPESFEYGLCFAITPGSIAVRANLPIDNPKDFIKHLRTTEKPVNISVDMASGYIIADHLIELAGVDSEKVKYIRYKSGNLAALDLVSGQVEYAILPLATTMALANDKKIKLVGVLTDRKMAGLNIDTIDSVVPGLHYSAMFGISFPKGTSKEVIDWYDKQFYNALQTDAVKKYYADNFITYDDRYVKGENFKKAMLDIGKKWSPVIKRIKE
jgi:tripartite-type tricarboxylate transporter receptor subunit TctC